jgi:hypothetical protein
MIYKTRKALKGPFLFYYLLHLLMNIGFTQKTLKAVCEDTNDGTLLLISSVINPYGQLIRKS